VYGRSLFYVTVHEDRRLNLGATRDETFEVV
jgi:hypothetical protein